MSNDVCLILQYSDITDRTSHAPNQTELKRILSDFDEDTNCGGRNSWTEWYSTSDIINGSDFEVLADHIDIFG